MTTPPADERERRLATTTYVVSGDNISSQLAFIHRGSGRIVGVTEIV